MIWNKLPFKIVLIATVLPWVAAYFDKKWITYIPIGLGLLTLLIYEVTRKKPKLIELNQIFLTLFSVTLIIASYQFITGIGIGSGGIIIIITLTFIFYRLFTSTKFRIEEYTLIRQIHIIYAIHVIFIICELGFRLAGGTEIIVSLVGNTTEVMKYKMYNKAIFLRYIGFTEMTGLGGMLLGSQSASQVALFSLFLFAPIFHYSPLSNNNYRKVMFFLSILVFLFAITMTASILSGIMFLIVIFFLPNSKLKNLKYQLSFISLALIFFGQVKQLLLFNIKNAYDLFVYYNSFMTSIRFYIEQGMVEKIFGLGKHAAKIMSSQLDLPRGVTSADFGFAMLLNQTGIIMVGLFVFLVIRNFIQVRLIIGKLIKLRVNYTKWAWLGTINALIALGWLLSLIHYTAAIELGGRELFAFHLAISLYAIKNMQFMVNYNYGLDGG